MLQAVDGSFEEDKLKMSCREHVDELDGVEELYKDAEQRRPAGKDYRLRQRRK